MQFNSMKRFPDFFTLGRFRSWACVSFMLLSILASCNREPRNTAENKLIITASFYPIYIMTLNIAGNVPGVTIRDLTSPQTGCLHDYQFTPADMRTIYGTAIFIANGLGMETFLDKILKQVPGLKMIDASAGLPVINDPRTRIPNPHVFVSISGAIGQVWNITARLAVLDPQHAMLYLNNGKNYIQKLDRLRAKMLKTLAPMKGTEIVTFHEAFPYFAREFGFKIVGVIERDPGSEPGARELEQTITLIKNNRRALVFAEPQYPSKSVQVIAKETGTPVRTLDPAVTGPDNPDAYLDIMEKNLKVLSEASHTK
jgi:zinc transport system substrate-binding protein